MDLVIAEIFGRSGADDLMSEYLDRCMKSDKFINDVIKRMESGAIFKRPGAGLTKRNIDPYSDECRLCQLHAMSEHVDRAGPPLPPSTSSSEATGRFKFTHDCKRSQSRRGKHKNR